MRSADRRRSARVANEEGTAKPEARRWCVGTTVLEREGTEPGESREMLWIGEGQGWLTRRNNGQKFVSVASMSLIGIERDC